MTWQVLARQGHTELLAELEVLALERNGTPGRVRCGERASRAGGNCCSELASRPRLVAPCYHHTPRYPPKCQLWPSAVALSCGLELWPAGGEPMEVDGEEEEDENDFWDEEQHDEDYAHLMEAWPTQDSRAGGRRRSA